MSDPPVFFNVNNPKTNEPEPNGKIVNCLFKKRPNDPPMFSGVDGRLVVNLDGYAIIPIEEYEELQQFAHPSLQDKIYKEMDEQIIKEILGENPEDKLLDKDVGAYFSDEKDNKMDTVTCNNSNSFFSSSSTTVLFEDEPIPRCLSFDASFEPNGSYKGTLEFPMYDPSNLIYDRYLGKTGSLKVIATLENGEPFTLFDNIITFDSKHSFYISVESTYATSYLGFTLNKVIE